MTGQDIKNSILQLAIQGKLVPQDPNDEPASELLKRIRKEKEQLVKEKKIKKKDLVTTPVSDEEKPFDIPESWEWCRLGEICIFLSRGKSPKYSDVPNQYPVFAQKCNLKEGGISLEQARFLKPETLDKWQDVYKLRTNDILINSTGTGTVCRTRLFHEKYLGSYPYVMPDSHVSVVRTFNYINSSFYYYIFNSKHIQDYWEDRLAGSTNQKELYIGTLQDTIIPLPPLSEQHRIVEKIEALMPKVEKYDRAQVKLDKLNRSLPEDLKQSILQEAIMGRLGTQDTNDEPASELLKRIRKEKEQLIKDKKIKKEKPLPEIKEEDKPFDIPENWEWCRLGEIGIFERGNGIKRDETKTEGHPCVRYGEMYTIYRNSPTFDKTVSFTTKEVFEKCRKAHKGDLFMALTGENKQDIALAAQYTGEEEIAVGGDLCHFTIIDSYGLYLVYLINSPYYLSQKEEYATGNIIVHISADKLGSIVIPLPPLAEQHRIVEKVEALLGKIERIKK